jgi:hypothetical protein
VLTRKPLGNNEILQMAGRVHGRVENGEVWILSEREIDFGSLRPTAPNFQLAGDPERVAMTCADMGVRADELDLPVPLDRIAYRRAVETLTKRGLIANNRLTDYGRKVEVLPWTAPGASCWCRRRSGWCRWWPRWPPSTRCTACCASRTTTSAATSSPAATTSRRTASTRTRWSPAARWGTFTAFRGTSSTRRRWPRGRTSAACW